VDHASQLSYVHLQSRVTAEETVEAKKAFEAYARSHGVIVKHYHADNGRFAESLFMSVVAESGQTISFCGVSAHFQNGIAEKRIRDLSEQARKQLVHAKADGRQQSKSIYGHMHFAMQMTFGTQLQTKTMGAHLSRDSVKLKSVQSKDTITHLGAPSLHSTLASKMAKQFPSGIQERDLASTSDLRLNTRDP
jgi:hypothetical protein